ncbi:hypothetical protein PTSG_11335 [Salpingoeca rosetta]|uniref:Peptidase M14 domain-containing protein n=1 Tax=Salpingoeca rosetta (strain ATCC 50818 / BSB-021) TaxID=946362 RepID=F2UT39_SALR5|nr:uncharacterized protein PTSG_11335 [Salpingoeca rosetta]EGD81298.1 hypothetical protein PTSG_11335 [Salpingoeca rosetta]|eukprot:XP_004987694.1 hypothetical protein PTSG_11335 [Salpingoeca rosetta]
MSYDVERRLRERLEKMLGGHNEIRHRFYDGIAKEYHTDVLSNTSVAANADGEDQEDRDASGAVRHTEQRRASAPMSTAEQAKLSTQVEYVVVGGKQVVTKLKTPMHRKTVLPQERDTNTQPQPRWPTDIDMVYPAPSFPYYNAPEPEPFHQRADPGYVERLRVRLIRGTGPVVYERRISPAPQFLPSRVREYTPISEESDTLNAINGDNGSNGALRHAVDADAGSGAVASSGAAGDEDHLHFDSCFESGNLQTATKIGPTEYMLDLSTDLYTTRHTQWFFFRVTNMKGGETYTFNIMNLLKSDSLYNHGMQPVVFSGHLYKSRQIGWHRGGDNVCYFRNHVNVNDTDRHHYTLSWTFKFPANNDTVYFAHCYPYTYSDLQHYITALMQSESSKNICRHRVLCRTLAGNVCDLLTVTNFGVPQAEMETRKGVIITARVHPGETNASWMMKGFLDFITGTTEDAQLLRDNFVFKIVPMLNPDGVIVGNYRCSLAGVDLNRTYKHTIRELYPTIYSVKIMMQRLARDRPVVMYCDLHGHSRKHNVFIYGCNNRTNPDRLLTERIFPLIMHLNGQAHFSYKSSKFSVKKCKESTGRVVTWRELNIVNAFTMEATFCGSTMGRLKKRQFRPCDFEELGEIFFDSLLDYCDPDQAKTNLLWSRLRSEAMQRGADVHTGASGLSALLADPANNDDDEDDSPGSDSSPSEGETEKAEIRFRFGERALHDAAAKKQAGLRLQLLRRADSEPSVLAGGKKTGSAGKGKTRRKKKKKTKGKHRPPEDFPGNWRRDADSEDNDDDDDDDNDDNESEGSGRMSRSSSASAFASTPTRRRRSRLREKYKRLSNRGIPTFANDRVAARAARKSAAVHRDDDGDSRRPAITEISPSVLDFVSSGDEVRSTRSASIGSPTAITNAISGRNNNSCRSYASSPRMGRSGLATSVRAESLSPKLLARGLSPAAKHVGGMSFTAQVQQHTHEDDDDEASHPPPQRHLSTQFLQLDVDFDSQRKGARQPHPPWYDNTHLQRQGSHHQHYQHQHRETSVAAMTMSHADMQWHSSHQHIDAQFSEDVRVLHAMSSSSSFSHTSRRTSRSSRRGAGLQQHVHHTPSHHHSQHSQQQQQRGAGATRWHVAESRVSGSRSQHTVTSTHRTAAPQTRVRASSARVSPARSRRAGSSSSIGDTRVRDKDREKDRLKQRDHTKATATAEATTATTATTARATDGGDDASTCSSGRSGSRRRSRSVEKLPIEHEPAHRPYPAGTLSSLYENKFGHVHPREDLRESSARRVHTGLLQRQQQVAQDEGTRHAGDHPTARRE